MDCKVIVLGKNYSTPIGVIRSLANAGYPVDLLYVATSKGDSEIVAASKYLDRTIEVIGRHDQEIVDALLSNYADSDSRCVLFPTDDYTTLLIDRFHDRLSKRFLFPYVIDGSVAQKMDKSFQSKLAATCGLKTAREWVISLDTDDISLPKDIPFPCFVKPMISAAGGKSELGRCDDLRQLDAKLHKMQNRLRERCVLVQEFLSIRQEYTFGGICNDQTVILPGIIKKTRVAQHFRGITMSGIMVENDELGDEMAKILRFLKSIRLVGMFDMEVMLTDRGLYFGELNLRCGGPSYAYFMSGINLPALAVKAVCGESLDGSGSAMTFNKRFVNNKVAYEDYAYLFIGASELKQMFRESDFTLMTDKNDPVPEERFFKQLKPEYQKLRIKNQIKRLLGRY